MVAALSYVTAKVKLEMAVLQPNISPPYLDVGRDHTGKVYEVAIDDATSDNLLRNLDVK